MYIPLPNPRGFFTGGEDAPSKGPDDGKPFGCNDCRHDPFSASPVPKRDHLRRFARLGAEPIRGRLNRHTSQIQPIRIPTRLNRYIRFCVPVRMMSARVIQKLEFCRVDVEEASPQRTGEIGTAPSVAGVNPFINTLAVVKNGKKGYEFCVSSRLCRELQPVLQHPAPVRQTVQSIPRQWVPRQYLPHQRCWNYHLVLFRLFRRRMIRSPSSTRTVSGSVHQNPRLDT